MIELNTKARFLFGVFSIAEVDAKCMFLFVLFIIPRGNCVYYLWLEIVRIITISEGSNRGCGMRIIGGKCSRAGGKRRNLDFGAWWGMVGVGEVLFFCLSVMLVFLCKVLRFEWLDIECLGFLGILLFINRINTANRCYIIIKSYYLLDADKIKYYYRQL